MMPADEVEHLVQRDTGHLRGAANRDPPFPQSVEGIIYPGLAQAPLDELTEGLRPIGLEPFREAVDLPKALLGEADRNRLGHV